MPGLQAPLAIWAAGRTVRRNPLRTGLRLARELAAGWIDRLSHPAIWAQANQTNELPGLWVRIKAALGP